MQGEQRLVQVFSRKCSGPSYLVCLVLSTLSRTTAAILLGISTSNELLSPQSTNDPMQPQKREGLVVLVRVCAFQIVSRGVSEGA